MAEPGTPVGQGAGLVRRLVEALPKGFAADLLLIHRLNLAALPPTARARALGRLLVGRLRGERGAPTSLVVAVTDACQCRCRHCGVADGRTESRLGVAEVEAVVREYAALGGVRIVFTGGEPLLHEDLVRMVEAAAGQGLSTHVNTNGILLSREMALDLRAAGLCSVELSIDSLDEERMDRNRRYTGALEAAKSAIRAARQVGLAVTINTVAFRESLDGELERLIAHGREVGVDAVRINTPEAAGRWREAREQLLGPEELARYHQLYQPGFVIASGCGQIRDRTSNCSGLNGRMLSVRPDGAVTPCPYLPAVLGSIRDESLTVILGRARKLRDLGQFSGLRCPSDDPTSGERIDRILAGLGR